MISSLSFLLAVAFGYLAGTTPTATLAARLATAGRVDLRTTDDGNPGAANAVKTLGWAWGVAVLLVDLGKGAGAAAAGAALGGTAGAALAGTASVCGHVWPIWSRGRGGKGVATSAGYCLATFPLYFPIDLAVAVATASAKRSGETAVRTASAIWVAAAVLWWQAGLPVLWGPGADVWLVVGAAASSAVILYAFRRAARLRAAQVAALAGSA